MSEQTDVLKKGSADLEKSLTTLAWLVNINAKDLAKKHEKEDKGRPIRFWYTIENNQVFARIIRKGFSSVTGTCGRRCMRPSIRYFQLMRMVTKSRHILTRI
jgi:hypothetical protein